ncbi:hypothetical protein D6T64_11795 [Cryobacterium melibiosiphilum]|uniref:Uncharacterized protein n=1 Tax=Cryobacterium melibiosiphilum TaxID=995039 RepID=A0A3A5MG27_9MICO|nr:hypothetical protein [Cryobacterium melibiosiphilum]RJT88065.1 hypothetical protein D6T64_11795 [Cryobacterium melibiosiphilum]
MSAVDAKHLWEFDHPYYCSQGCYYTKGTDWEEVHRDWETWADFAESWGDSDEDYNLLFRWDWKRSDPDHYAFERTEDPAFEMPADHLELFYMLQRKAKPFSHIITVTETDEPAVREWLTKKAEHMRKVWEPLLNAGCAA